MSGSPLDPLVHLLTTLALTVGGAALATVSTVAFLRWLACTGPGLCPASGCGRC
jgi:hypothetical protein